MLHKLSTMTLGDFLQLWGNIIAIGSILSIFLPPIEWFNDFPRFQRGYRMLIVVVNHYLALNLRGKIAEFFAGEPQSGLPDATADTKNVVTTVPQDPVK